jgi:hypothetical protein
MSLDTSDAIILRRARSHGAEPHWEAVPGDAPESAVIRCDMQLEALVDWLGGVTSLPLVILPTT